MILSQLIRGAAEELASRPGELVDPVLIGAAMARAADRAYDSVREPAEGTILTVVREMAHRVATELAHMQRAAAASRTTPTRQDALIAEVLERALDAGQESVRRGPDLLPVLREAGVVDAGGYGLTVIFAGVVAALRGTEAPELDHHAPGARHASAARVLDVPLLHELRRHRRRPRPVGVGRAARGDRRLGARRRRRSGRSRSTSTPTSRSGRPPCSPAPARSRASTSPTCTSRSQQRVERLAEPTAGAAASSRSSPARAWRSCSTSLGATPLPGGPTLNPSTYELLAGIHDVPAEEVVVLPNSPNVLMAAERAAELSDKRVCVVPTRSQQAGLAAAVALDPDARRRRERRGDGRGARAVRTGAVTGAARDDAEERPARFHRGDAVGFVDERHRRLGRAGARRSRRCSASSAARRSWSR